MVPPPPAPKRSANVGSPLESLTAAHPAKPPGFALVPLASGCPLPFVAAVAGGPWQFLSTACGPPTPLHLNQPAVVSVNSSEQLETVHWQLLQSSPCVPLPGGRKTTETARATPIAAFSTAGIRSCPCSPSAGPTDPKTWQESHKGVRKGSGGVKKKLRLDKWLLLHGGGASGACFCSHLQPKDVTTEQQPSISHLLCALSFLPLPPLRTDIHIILRRGCKCS